MKIKYTNAFKKDYKRCKKRSYDITKLDDVILLIQQQETAILISQYRDQALSGNWFGFRELHIQPDWLSIYNVNDDELILTLMRTGTHSDLF